ncbi:MAG: ABC transporter permease [Myxococcales bacterium]|nr:ABC transporter permease [Myxococcales bacterium]
MSRIYAVALNTFREAVRDRVLYGVLAFAIAVLTFTLVLAELSLNQERRVVSDIGLASISLFSVIIAVFLGSSLLYKEIERKTLYVIIPKPIHRYEFLLGKYFGIVLTSAVFVAIMGAVLFMVASVQLGVSLLLTIGVSAGLLVLLGVGLYLASDHTSVLLPWSLLAVVVATFVARHAGVVWMPYVASLGLNVGEALVITAVALFFSSFSTPFLTGLFTFGVWLLGRSADDMATIHSKLLGPGIERALHVLAEVVPNFNLFVPGRHALLATTTEYGGPALYVGRTLGYAVLISGLLLTLAALIFRRRDFL